MSLQELLNQLLDYIQFTQCKKCDELLPRFSKDISCDYCDYCD